MLYMVYVYNSVKKYWDSYLVKAENKEAAADEARRRLDEETDEGSRGYEINDIVLYS